MPTQELQQETLWVTVGEGTEKESSLHLKRFFTDPKGSAIFMVHGSVESGRIFYSKSGRGVAPFLAKQGFDAYVVDLRGRGESRPKVSPGDSNTQLDAIEEEIPACIAKIRELRGQQVPLHAVAHSWGGVMLLAYLARFPQETFESMAFFGTKRSIAVKSLKKFLAVDFVWAMLGEFWTRRYGYYPAKEKKVGSDNEAAQVYRHCRAWVKSLNKWMDPEDGFDYLEAFKQAKNIPPTLYIAGQGDAYLGNPYDVSRLMEEVGNPEDQLLLLSKKNGYHKDYGHIDMCTSKQAVEEHFPKVAAWLERQGQLGSTQT